MNMESITGNISGAIWNNGLVWGSLVLGLFFTIRFGAPQVTKVRDMLRYLIKGEKSDTGTSSFQSFAMALAGRIGTGAIAGVATAIYSGGPGAVFWMWMIGILGAASAFNESTLGQVFKEEVHGEYRGGPAFYIKEGLKRNLVIGGKNVGARLTWLGVLFAILAVFSKCICEGPVQSYNIADATQKAFGVPMWVTGIVVTALLAFIIFGGMRRIATFAQWVVPFMTVGYVVVLVIVLVSNGSQIPAMFGLIFRNAFGLDPVMGGILGSTILWGVKRGVYSSEAGLGTGAQAAAAAEVSHPVKQGLAQAFSVYCDIILAATSTALMILVTGMYNVENPAGGFFTQGLPGMEPGAGYTQEAVNTVLPGFGPGFVAVALMFFAFTTIVSFGFYADTNIAFLFKGSKWFGPAQTIGKLALLGMVLFGSMQKNVTVWNFADIGVGLNVWVNLIGITLLSGVTAKMIKDYNRQRRLGLDPVFDPDEVGIHDAGLWKKIVSKKYGHLVQSNQEILGKETE
ncbi:MAG: alanine:cation symporter family protein [Clostridiales Family XIII bacterium]|jgi:AGCS family alanine or glycine:cation symporter|nr:alanine:cation symporter family protein [Clostridiales Family XIII bacterium]